MAGVMRNSKEARGWERRTKGEVRRDEVERRSGG